MRLQPPPGVSPRDRFLTVYGRNPVLEALTDATLTVDKVLLADTARGRHVEDIVEAARRRQVPVQRVSAERVKKLAGNGRQDQGVCADVVAPRMRPLDVAVAQGLDGPVLVLDGITTPANVGMILRTAKAAGWEGVVVPRRGVASLDPLVVKASAGVAFVAPVLKAATAADAVGSLRDGGFSIVGMRADAPTTLFDAALPRRSAYVLGSESTGVSGQVAGLVERWVAIPVRGGVDSLNVSAAAAVLCFEVVRRGEQEDG